MSRHDYARSLIFVSGLPYVWSFANANRGGAGATSFGCTML